MDDFLGANAMEPPTERMDQQEPQNASTDHPGPSTARADQPGPSNADVPGTSANAYKKHKKNKKRDPQALAQVPDEEAVDFEEQMHRRETVFQITQQFGGYCANEATSCSCDLETVQKMQKGVEEEMTSEEVVASIEQVDISQVRERDVLRRHSSNSYSACFEQGAHRRPQHGPQGSADLGGQVH